MNIGTDAATCLLPVNVVEQKFAVKKYSYLYRMPIYCFNTSFPG
jgi:hypothetical protein